MISQILPRTGRISGPEVEDGAKPDFPTTDRQNEKNKKQRVLYEAVDAHARRRLIKLLLQYLFTNLLGLHESGPRTIASHDCFSFTFP